MLSIKLTLLLIASVAAMPQNHFNRPRPGFGANGFNSGIPAIPSIPSQSGFASGSGFGGVQNGQTIGQGTATAGGGGFGIGLGVGIGVDTPLGQFGVGSGSAQSSRK